MPATLRLPKKVMTYICGDGGPLDDFNPSIVTRQKWASELLYTLNKRPLSAEQVCLELKISREEIIKPLEDLIRIKAIEEKSGVYHVAFSIFTKEDLMVLARATKQIADKLANRIYSHKKKITSLVKNISSAQQVEMDKLLFAAVGCFVLDWQGLKVLEDEGLLAKNKPQPGNRNYLLFAREEIDENMATRLYDAMYWGSHSDALDKYTFTSFGDHYGLRYAFPDILWTLHASSKAFQETFGPPLWFTEKLSTIIRLFGKNLLRDVALMLFRMNDEGPISEKEFSRNENDNEVWLQNLLHLLQDMNYIVYEKGTVTLHYPVFVAKDEKIMEELGDLITPLATQIIRQNYLHLKRVLGDITPMKNNIPFGEVLNEAWHWIFAQTNKILAEKGFLYTPPRKRAGEA
ncbi:MAG: hypothetical protein QMD13_05960 [Candidatus Bathyarchaeia archaeon]|nr:hypothetical protein [Candidatus Bathyarchaeia archaeon]